LEEFGDKFMDAIVLAETERKKISLHVMDTANAKKRWMVIYWRVNNFRTNKESHIVTRLGNERALFLNMNDINDISFLELLTAIIVVL
jgi:hypothetical protein